jgi:Mg2+/Co2+ transporter CorB
MSHPLEHGRLSDLEDVVEELVGEIHDALEAAQPSIQHTPDGRVLVRGEVRLRELNERFGWNFQDEEVDTIAGYIMKRLERVARVGDVIDTPYGIIRVENMAQGRITLAIIPPNDNTRHCLRFPHFGRQSRSSATAVSICEDHAIPLPRIFIEDTARTS